MQIHSAKGGRAPPIESALGLEWYTWVVSTKKGQGVQEDNSAYIDSMILKGHHHAGIGTNWRIPPGVGLPHWCWFNRFYVSWNCFISLVPFCPYKLRKKTWDTTTAAGSCPWSMSETSFCQCRPTPFSFQNDANLGTLDIIFSHPRCLYSSHSGIRSSSCEAKIWVLSQPKVGSQKNGPQGSEVSPGSTEENSRGWYLKSEQIVAPFWNKSTCFTQINPILSSSTKSWKLFSLELRSILSLSSTLNTILNSS